MSIQVANAMCLHFRMLEEDIIKHTNAKCHCVYFSQLVEHY